MSLCPVAAAAGGVGKGRRREASAANPGAGAQLCSGKKRGNREPGDRGRGVSAGKGCLGAVNESHSRFMGRSGAETGLRPRRSGPRMIRSLDIKTTDPGPRGPEGPGAWARGARQSSAREEPPPSGSHPL